MRTRLGSRSWPPCWRCCRRVRQQLEELEQPSASGSADGLVAPTQSMAPQTSVGKGEGSLNLIAWQGYTEPQWVKPFEQQTGCKVNAKYAGTSSDMVSLMANGGGGQYDLVSASGDADLRLIYGGDVRPVNIDLIPAWKDFHPFLQSPSFNTIDGKHYGVSLQFGPNVLLYSKTAFPSGADVVVRRSTRSENSGKVTVPDNPIQIADAALYLSETTAEPRHHRPVRAHPDAVRRSGQAAEAAEAARQEVLGLRDRRDLAVPEQGGHGRRGVAVPDRTAEGRRLPGGRDEPERGRDRLGRLVAARHEGAAPELRVPVDAVHLDAQAAGAAGDLVRRDAGEREACTVMDQLSKGSCEAYHANAPQSYFDTIKFWKTPLAQCGNGQNDCVPFQKWADAWTQITG